jgi:hypothetical protein
VHHTKLRPKFHFHSVFPTWRPCIAPMQGKKKKAREGRRVTRKSRKQQFLFVFLLIPIPRLCLCCYNDVLMAQSIRSESSASSTQTSSSFIPASIESRQQPSPMSSRMDSSQQTNGRADGSAKRTTRSTFGKRARSASLQKGAAVLKALARAPQEASDDDSGYEDEAGEAHVGSVPGTTTSDDTIVEEETLSEEAIQSGRVNREGLRKRKDDRKVERMVGKRTESSGSVDSTTGKKREKKKPKSWEIPRKMFHSSIGEYL